MSNNKEERICPACGSDNIRNDSRKEDNGIIGPGYSSWVVEEKYSCNECGVYFKPISKSVPNRKGDDLHEKAKMNTTNTALPAEIEKDIDDLAHKHTMNLPTRTVYETGYELGMERGIGIGAKEYALKWQEAQQENQELKDQIEKFVLDGRDKDFKGRELLQKFISRHEAGLLPDMHIYNEIKTFLDGK